jgi:cytosine/adenosine deaminase-related metal-dependent hydrolase
VGAHASFTLSDQTLDRVSAVVAGAGLGLHVHVAEDRADVEDAQRRCGAGVVARLQRHALLGPGALLAHGVHLSEAELEAAQGSGAWLLHCPRSNMNNGVGHARTTSFRRAALGTDGLDQDLLAEARAAFLKMRDAGREDALPAAVGLLAGGHRLASELFGLPFGRLAAGAPADLVVLDYAWPTPLTSDNLAGHLLFGVDRGHVRSTMVAGRFVLRDRRLATVDEAVVRERARGAAARLWERMERL